MQIYAQSRNEHTPMLRLQRLFKQRSFTLIIHSVALNLTLLLTQSLIRQAGACKASAVDCSRRYIINAFVLHPARVITIPYIALRTIAHRCHDKCLNVD